MKTTYIERFSFNTIFDLDGQREFVLRKIQLSKAASSRFYPVFVPRSAATLAESDPGE